MKVKYKIILIVLAIFIMGSGFLEYKYQQFLHRGKVKEESIVLVDEYLSINFLDGNHITGNGTIKVHFSISNTSKNRVKYYISLNNVMNAKDNLTYSLNNSKKTDLVDFAKLSLGDSIVGANQVIEPNESISYDLFINNASNFNMDINIGYERDYVNNLKDLIVVNSNNLITSTDSDGETILFPTDSLNNNVLIDDLKYQIVRINGDGSIRMMATEKIGESSFYSTPYLITFDYNNSTINNYLNEYYQNTLTKYDDIIVENKYCSDVNIFNTVSGVNYYESYNRASTNAPALTCNNTLTKKIGLLSADEYLLLKNNTDNIGFLKKNETYYTSSFAYLKTRTFPNMITIKEGNLNYDELASSNLAIYPVINLNSEVQAIGDGTENNPYQIIYQK